MIKASQKWQTARNDEPVPRKRRSGRSATRQPLCLDDGYKDGEPLWILMRERGAGPLHRCYKHGVLNNPLRDMSVRGDLV